MPMLAFFPWSTVATTLQFGSFEILPFGEVARLGEIPVELNEAVTAILHGHGHVRAVDREKLPILRQVGRSSIADLSDLERADYFGFRSRMAFSALSAREFFSNRYCGSDNLQLVIQGFDSDRPGAALIQTRRRDHLSMTVVLPGQLHVHRPGHVTSYCAFDKDIDAGLLDALERASTAGGAAWSRLAEVIELFVRANTDSSDISEDLELTDLVSAFSRASDSWNERDTVARFIALLPSPPNVDAKNHGGKLENSHLHDAINGGEPLRAAWLRDAYVLRGNFSHGRLESPYRSAWSATEHLLLGGWIFPIFVKMILARDGQYSLSAEDRLRNEAFDSLLTHDHFAVSPDADPMDMKSVPWLEVLRNFRLRAVADEIEREIDRETAPEC